MPKKQQLFITTIVILSAFFSGILLALYFRAETAMLETSSVIGKPLPTFSLRDRFGEQHNSAKWKGNVLAINFWATWCKPCLKEIPHFVELQQQYQDQGLQFLGIALEPLQNTEQVLAFADRFGINYPVFIGSYDVIQLAKKLGNPDGYLPYTLIIDRAGDINFVKSGYLPRSEAEKVITSLL